MPVANQSFLAWWPFNKIALKAGESVSELKALMTVETAMVSANCL